MQTTKRAVLVISDPSVSKQLRDIYAQKTKDVPQNELCHVEWQTTNLSNAELLDLVSKDGSPVVVVPNPGGWAGEKGWGVTFAREVKKKNSEAVVVMFSFSPQFDEAVDWFLKKEVSSDMFSRFSFFLWVAACFISRVVPDKELFPVFQELALSQARSSM